MSSGRIKGITIELNGDATGLNKALSGVEKNIASTQKALRDVNKLLKLDPTNTQLIEQKQRLLQTAISETKDKMEALKAADVQAKAQLEKGDLGQDKYDALQREIAETEQKLKGLENTVGSGNAKLAQISAVTGEFGQKAEAAGRKLMPLSAGAAAVGVASVKAASDWESAWVGVTKTVDGTDEQLKKVETGILDLAKTTGTSATEIAAVAQAAGQLGVGTDYLLEFTETMVRLGDSTDISADEAATAIAQLFNITGTSMEQTENFGAALVALGNKSATAESRIMDMATRIASSGNQIGMTEKQTLALAASLSSVGLETEAGGTAISTVMTNIDKAVALNSDTLSTWASTAGMSAAEFKSAWETDAYGAMQRIIAGMGDAKSGGENLNVILDELGITGIRTSDTMKRLSSASGMMGELTQISSDAWAENTALVEESDKVYETFAREIGKTKETLIQAGATIGNELMPYIKKLAEFVSALAEKFANMSPTMQKFVTAILAITLALGPLLVGIGKVSTGISAVTGAFSKMKNINKVSGAFTSLAGIATKAIGGIKTAVTSLFALISANPVVAIVIAIIAVIVLLWNKCEWFREGVIAIWNGIKEAFSAILEWFKTLPETFSGIWTSIKTGAENIWNAIKNFFSSILAGIGTTFSVAWNAIKSGISSAINAIKTTIVTVFTSVKDSISNIFTSAKNAVASIWDGIKTFVSSTVSSIKNAAVNAFRALVDGIRNALGGVVSVVKNGFSGAIDFITSMPKKALTWGKDFIQGLISGIKSKIGDIVGAVKGVASKIKSFLHFSVPDEGPLTDYETWMPDFMSGLAKGIKNNVYRVDNALKSLTGKMADCTGDMNMYATANGANINVESPAVMVQIGNEEVDKYIVKAAKKGISKDQMRYRKARGR